MFEVSNVLKILIFKYSEEYKNKINPIDLDHYPLIITNYCRNFLSIVQDTNCQLAHVT